MLEDNMDNLKRERNTRVKFENAVDRLLPLYLAANGFNVFVVTNALRYKLLSPYY